MTPRRATAPAWISLAQHVVARLGLIVLCSAGTLLALAPVPAGATVIHKYEGSFSAEETPSKAFGYVLALAVDDSGGASAGDLYVGTESLSGTSSYVYKFNENGKYADVELNGSETPQGSYSLFDSETFEISRGLAVDGSGGTHKGDVYLADAEHHVIDRFSEAGKFLCQITGRTPTTTEETEHECAGATGSKTPQNGFTPGGFFSQLGVAVNPVNGDVYVSDPGDDVVDEFNEAGEYIGHITDPHIKEPGSLAFNSSGELYVTNGSFLISPESVVKLSASGAFVSVLNETTPEYVAVNPASGRVFVAEQSHQTAAEYDASGKLISTFGQEQSGSVGVSGSSGKVYVSPPVSESVYMYGKAVVVPAAKTGEASQVQEKGATLHGEVEPDLAHDGSNITSCEFEYASKYTLDHIQTVSMEGAGTFQIWLKLGNEDLPGESEETGWHGFGRLASRSTSVNDVVGYAGTPVAGEAISGPGIMVGTTIVSYSETEHKIVLSQATETISVKAEGEKQQLSAALTNQAGSETVMHALEALRTVGSGNVTVSGAPGGPWRIEFSGALANAAVPLLRVSSARFTTVNAEPDWSAADKTACEPPAPYSEPKSVSAKVSGLTPSMPYTFRVTASDSEGASDGEDQGFVTPGPPSVDRTAAEAKQTSTRFWAKINPFGSETTCKLQYVSETGFQASQWANATNLPCSPNDLGSKLGDTEFPYATDAVAMAKVSGLERGITYRYRFIATNNAGSSAREGTFETWGIKHFSMEVLKGSREIFGVGGNEIIAWEPGEAESPLQAGAHPRELVTTIDFSLTEAIHRCENALSCPLGHIGEEVVEGNNTLQNVKDVRIDLPPGLLGNPTNFPKCSARVAEEGECPSDSQIGVLEYQLDKSLSFADGYFAPTAEEEEASGCGSYCIAALYNLEPRRPTPAEFGSPGNVTKAAIVFSPRTGSDYGISADSLNIVAAASIRQIRVRIWGMPASPAHENGRRVGCPVSGKCSLGAPTAPLLRNPTSCTGPLTVHASFDTWTEPGVYTSKTSQLAGVSGCSKLLFEPSFEARPTSTLADSATGLHVDLHVPQPEGCNQGGEDECELAEADLRDAKVVLPAGMAIDPSSADGLQACTETQVGYLAQNSAEVGYPQFTPGPAECPDAAKIGTVEVDTPLIAHPLSGGVYVAQQNANPFNSLLALYITIYDPATGVVIKLPGRVDLDPQTGQLTTTFDENPQLPFEDFKLDFFSGSRGALTTPLVCGSYSAATDMTPWSAPEGKDAFPSSQVFAVTGPNGGACVSSEGQAANSPGFEAGTASPVAGSYSPFVLKLKREDASQHFGSLNVTLPPGLIGKIAGLERCPQADIEAAQARSHEGEGAVELAHPSCPAGSEVGVVHVGAGSGAPLFVTGHAYFAGPYKGAPFSLVIVTPAVTGPFDLGTVVVRAALFIDPNTAQVTVKSDPFPSILDGIPLDIRSVNVDMNRKEFTLNPTSCSVMSLTGQETSIAGQTVGLSDRFQAGGCTTLPFHPVFEASTSGVTSRKDGASLSVHVGSGAGQANIGKVHVTLPKQLPSRLETLKGACLENVFAANPATCPSGSDVGSAVAHTPILNSPLSGPVYIVSHGGAAFPDLEVVLQGEGVTIILDGKTNIKNGVTESSFEAVPDAPVSSFELSLPEGAHSILAAPGENLCSLATRTVLVSKKVLVKVKRHGHVQKKRVTRKVKKTIAAGLAMPTMIQGQNGAVINQNTPIAVTGCGSLVKHKAKKHGKQKAKKHSKHGAAKQHG